jgi:hypothetical protein
MKHVPKQAHIIHSALRGGPRHRRYVLNPKSIPGSKEQRVPQDVRSIFELIGQQMNKIG